MVIKIYQNIFTTNKVVHLIGGGRASLTDFESSALLKWGKLSIKIICYLDLNKFIFF